MRSASSYAQSTSCSDIDPAGNTLSHSISGRRDKNTDHRLPFSISLSLSIYLYLYHSFSLSGNLGRPSRSNLGIINIIGMSRNVNGWIHDSTSRSNTPPPESLGMITFKYGVP